MKNRYNCAYVIRAEATTIGLIGLYDLCFDEMSRVSLSLLIPGRENRRHGYGKEACELVIDKLRKNRVLKEVVVTLVDPTDGTLAFWTRGGFRSKTKNWESKKNLFFSLADDKDWYRGVAMHDTVCDASEQGRL
jgi:hypothetical protein